MPITINVDGWSHGSNLALPKCRLNVDLLRCNISGFNMGKQIPFGGDGDVLDRSKKTR